MFLEILSPDEAIFSGEVDSVQLPGTKGSFEVLKNHAPIISSLSKGNINIKEKGQVIKSVSINSGFVEVLDNKINVLISPIRND